MQNKDEIDQFISLKRAKKELKEHWGRLVIETALALINQYGRFVEISNISSRPKQAKYKSIKIMLVTPFNQLEILPGVKSGYMLDIWKDQKVFSARWEPLSISKFYRSDWLYTIFQDEIDTVS